MLSKARLIDSNEDLLQIAAVLKSNGVKGELLVGFKEISAEDIDAQEPVFIIHDGLPVPYFIESITPKGTGKALVRLSGVESLEDSEELCGRPLLGRARDYPELVDDESLEALIGWTVKDRKGRIAGEICDIEDIPGNPCIVLQAKSGQHLLPLHVDLILSLDPDSSVIQIDIPEGLLSAD